MKLEVEAASSGSDMGNPLAWVLLLAPTAVSFSITSDRFLRAKGSGNCYTFGSTLVISSFPGLAHLCIAAHVKEPGLGF